MPPNKNESTVAKPGGLLKWGNPTNVKEVKISLPPVKSGNNSSCNSYPSPSPAQIQDESMMQVDQAIVAIGKSDLKVVHNNIATKSKNLLAQSPSTHDRSSDPSFGERAKLINTVPSYPSNSETSQPHGIDRLGVSQSDTPQDVLQIDVIPDDSREPMQEQPAIPSDIGNSEVFRDKSPNNNQGREKNQEFSDPPIGEKSTVVSLTESLASNTVICVSIAGQDNSIISSDVKQLDEERQLLAMNEVNTNVEPVITAGSQQLLTSMIPIIADMNSEVPHKKSRLKDLVLMTSHPTCHSGKDLC